MGARGINGKKKVKRRAHKKTPEQQEVLKQRLLQETAQRRANGGR